jgi:hypothetical protein
MSSIQHIQNKGRHQCSCYIFEMFLICRASTVHKHTQVSQQLPANRQQTQAISAHNIAKKDARGTPYTCEQNYGHQQHGQLCRAANSCQLRRRKKHYYTQDIEASLEYMQSTTLPHHKTAIQGPDQDKELYAPAKAVSTLSRPPTRQCKARFFRFHHGGPKRQKRGDRQNEITYEAPCLQLTCANCWKWNPHLMCTDDEGQHRSIQSLAEPVRSNDGISVESAQAMQKRRHDSVFSELEDCDLAPSPRSDRDVTRLAFHSQEGRQKYAALIRTCEAQEKEEYWRSLERKGMSPRSAGSSCGSAGSAKSGSSSGRSRHRVRLVFDSQIGKQDFARLMQRYSC